MTDTPPKMQEVATNENHLAGLSCFNYIFGGIQIVVAVQFLLFVILGCVLFAKPVKEISTALFGCTNDPLLARLARAVLFALLCLILLGTLGAAHVYSGLCIKRHRKRLFSLVLAGFDCLLVPLGTVLGVSALIVLNRESVKRMYKV
jgi:hypothetical protein